MFSRFAFSICIVRAIYCSIFNNICTWQSKGTALYVYTNKKRVFSKQRLFAFASSACLQIIICGNLLINSALWLSNVLIGNAHTNDSSHSAENAAS